MAARVNESISFPIPSLVSESDESGNHSSLSGASQPFYEALWVMTSAAIEAAFSGNDGSLRDEPDAYHRGRDEALSLHRAERDEVMGATVSPHRQEGL